MQLSDKERSKFQRQLNLPGFGEDGQLRLKGAHVLVIGMGGLGNPVALYLAAAGVGTLTLVDFDTVEPSNLHRQVLFGINDCGKKKAEVAAEKLHMLHPETCITPLVNRADARNLENMLDGVDLVADCTDNFETRYALADTLSPLNIPLVVGAAHQREGWLALLHGNAGVSYRDAYPLPPESGRVGTCETEGVSGPMVGIIGSMMAQCIMDFLALGTSEADGRIIRFDGIDFKTYVATIQKQLETVTPPSKVTALSKEELEKLLQQSAPPQLIDVREPFEHEDFHIGGICLPAGDVKQWSHALSAGTSLVLYCNTGTLSYMAAHVLVRERPDLHVAHLNGGLESWQSVIEQSRAKAIQ